MRSVLASALCSVVVAVVLPGLAQEKGKAVGDEILQDAAKVRDHIGVTQCDPAGLIELFEEKNAAVLPIVQPGMGPRYPALTEHVGVICFDPTVFPTAFLMGLAGEEVKRGGVPVHPVRIREGLKGKKRVRVVETASSGRTLAVVPTPVDYDPAYYARKVFARLPPARQTKDELKRLCGQYDPARVEVTVDLLDIANLGRYAVQMAAESLMCAQREAGKGQMGKSGGSPGVSNLGFVAAGMVGPLEGPKNLRLTIGWPTNALSTNGVDFFVTTNLLGTGSGTGVTWSIALTTNVNLNTNRFSWIDEDATNYSVRYYDCWTLHDYDEDALSDGREVRLWGTTTNDWDSDNDGLSDGYEAAENMDPLDADEDGDLIVDGDEIEWFGDLDESPATVVTNGASTIQSAINAASSGDIVLVLPGTYTGAGNRNLDFGGKDIFLLGQKGAQETVVDAEESGRGFVFDSGETEDAHLVGFTITGGSADCGGGIYCVTSSPVIAECVISNNAVTTDGGGICLRGSDAVARDCFVRDSVAGENGGGVCVQPHVFVHHWEGNDDIVWSVGASPTIEGCVLTGNSAKHGGAMHMRDTPGELFFVGGDPIEYHTPCKPVVRRCLMARNVADTGAVHLAYYSDSSAIQTIENCAIVGNACGGVHISMARARLRNCTIAYNAATISSGAGVYAVHYDAGPVPFPGDTEIRNSIVRDNDPAQSQIRAPYNHGDCDVVYSCYDTTAGQGTDYVDYGPNCITTDALLCWSGHLRSGSPCIGAGTLSGAPDDDIDEETRVGAVDMGCDEFLDSDGDALPDWWEKAHFVNRGAAVPGDDSDSDGLVNSNEYLVATDPMGGWQDGDGDLLSDDRETWLGTDPAYWDSDDDGMSDGWEDAYGFDPAVSNNPSADSDGDGWSDGTEAAQGTDPDKVDTDGDGKHDPQDADPTDPDNDSAALDGVTVTDMTLLVGDRSPSHSERYMLVVGPYQVFMSYVDAYHYEFSSTVRVPVGKTYNGYLQSLSDDDDDGDYTAEVSGTGVVVDDPWPSDRMGRVLGGHHEDSEFNSGQRTFTVTTVATATDPDTTDKTSGDEGDANTTDPINVINGNVSLRETDIVVPRPGLDMAFVRLYNSHLSETNALGPRWTHSYDWRLWAVTNRTVQGRDGDWVMLRTGGGEKYWFKDEGGVYEPPPEVNWTLSTSNQSWLVDFDGAGTAVFSAGGVLQSISDGLGNSVTLGYSGSELATVRHSSGEGLDVAHSSGRISQVKTWPIPYLTVDYIYNGSGELTNAVRTPAAGQAGTTTYGYGAHHSLTQRVNAVGDISNYAYTFVTNAEGVICAKGTKMWMHGGWYEHEVDYHTNHSSTVTYRREGADQVYTFAYDAALPAVTSIRGPETNILVTSVVDAGGDEQERRTTDEASGEYVVVRQDYDAEHHPTGYAVGLNAPALHTWRMEWNRTNDVLTAEIDPADVRTDYEYDGKLLTRAAAYPAPGETAALEIGYTTNGLVAALTNANGHVTRFTYADGRLESVIPAAGPVVSNLYVRQSTPPYARKDVVSLPAQSGPRRETTFWKNGMEAVYRVDYPDDSQETMGYNALGALTAFTNAAGSVTHYEYLPSRKLEKIVHAGWDGLRITNRFEYNQQFNTLGIVEPRGRYVETYALDVQDRPVAVTNIEGQTMSVTYGIGDVVKSVERFDGTVVSNTWDRHGRLEAVHYSDQTVAMTYLDNGLVSSVSNAAGVVSNSYDGANRLVSVASGGSSARYLLDGVGNATNVLVTMGALSLNNAATFDAAERLSGETTEEGEFVYTYHAHNGLIATISNVASKVNVRYDYDVMDRITNIVWRNKWGQTRRSFAQTYSPDGLITNIVREWSDYNTEYTHDSLGRLTSGSQGILWNGTYTWDAAGNPGGSTYGTGNRIYSSRYEYADSGCITEIDLNVPFHDPVNLTWNSQYQLTSIESDDSVLASYEYDALGRRQRAVTESGTVTNVFVYDGAQVVADLDGEGNLLRTYTWAPGIDRLLAMTVHTGATAVTYYALTDHLGSVHAWLSADGYFVERYEYNPWGKIESMWNTKDGIFATSSIIGNRYLWHGREYEWATHEVLDERGLYYFRARWYSPYETYGRWLSKDPIGIAGGLNQYVICGNNPVMCRDPFGLVEHVVAAHRAYPRRRYTVNIRFSEGWVRISRTRIVKDVAELRQLLQRYDKKISRIHFFGHGGIPGDDWSSRNLWSFAETLRPYMEKGGLIYLDGCNAAKKRGWAGTEPSVAAVLSERLPDVRVKGNPKICSRFQAQDGSWKEPITFLNGKKIKQTVW